MQRREGMIVFVINNNSDVSNTKLSDIYLAIYYLSGTHHIQHEHTCK